MKYERDERRKLRGELYSQLGSPETSFRAPSVGRILSKAPGQSRIANVVVGPKPVRLSFPGIAWERYNETTAAACGNSANKHGVHEEFLCLQ